MKCPFCGHDNLPGADACEQCQTSLTQEDIRQSQSDIETSLMQEQISSLQPEEPLTVRRGTTLQQAIRIMRDRRIGCVAVVDDAASNTGRLVGVLTERDLLQKVAGQGLDFSQCMVEDFMSPAPESSKAEHPLAYALHRMIISDIRYLPIVDEDDRPEGIISSRDVIAYMNKRFSNR
jgi:CBS domain-containing protein